MTITPATTRTAARSSRGEPSDEDEPPVEAVEVAPLPPRSRDASPDRLITRMSRTWTTNPQTLSITPMEIAAPASMPLRPKKRTSRASLAAELGTASAMNWMAYSSMRTGPNRRGRNEAPRVAEGLRHRDHRRQRQRDGQPREVRGLELVDQVGEPDVGQRGDDRVGDQRDQDHHADRPERHPPELGELGKLDPGRVGAGLPQVVEVPVLVADRVPGLPLDRRRLQQRQHLGEGVGPQRGQRGRRGSFRPRRQRGRHQDLGAVGGDVGVVGGHLRAPEVPEGGCPVGPDHDPGGVQPSMRDPQGVEPGGVAPDAVQELVVDLAGAERPQWAAGRLGHQQRVAARMPSRRPRPGAPRPRPARPAA